MRWLQRFGKRALTNRVKIGIEIFFQYVRMYMKSALVQSYPLIIFLENQALI
jgi:hypothetical protein